MVNGHHNNIYIEHPSTIILFCHPATIQVWGADNLPEEILKHRPNPIMIQLIYGGHH
jgi:hypothetical protein